MVDQKGGLLKLQEVFQYISPEKYYKNKRNQEINSVKIDSREIEPDSLFICLKGEKTDGHNYIEDACRKNASYCLIEKSYFNENTSVIEDLNKRYNTGFIVSKDTLHDLKKLAKNYLKQFRGLIKIAITGSSGKTTTKEITASILSVSNNVVKNKGNFNSEIGLPLSVFEVNDAHEFGIFEMGMNRKAEIYELADIVKPDTALITNISKAHVGMIGSEKGIAEEKKSIFSFFTGYQKGFIFEDDPYQDFLKENIKAKIETFGLKTTPGCNGYEDNGINGSIIMLDNNRINLPLIGYYNVLNALAAVSIAKSYDVPFSDIKEGIETVSPLFGRGEIIKGDVTIIKDCYNANPDSTIKAIANLGSIDWKGRKILVLGSMLELGDLSDDLHKTVLAQALKQNLDAVFLFGSEFESAFRSVEGDSKKIYWSADRDKFKNEYKNFIKKNDLILFKGSRGVELEKFI